MAVSGEAEASAKVGSPTGPPNAAARNRSRVGRSGSAALMIVALWALIGCASGITRSPPPADLYFKARVPEFPTARFYGDKPLPDHAFDAASWLYHRLPVLRERSAEGEAVEAHLLLLSGGGADGAFGAGLLNGWTEHGDRPEFEIVTGVSVGALMAPFAFLGPDYDHKLGKMFLDRQSPDEIFDVQLFSALTGALSLGDSTPLGELIDAYIDDELLDAVAEEHRKGRRLYVGTTYLDAKRPVTWNIGAIAASGHPKREALIRQILQASTAVPGIAPPVFIDVELNGEIYQEMHVDGGVMNSLVLAVPTLTAEMRQAVFGDVRPTLWIIQNNKLRAPYEPTRESLSGVVGATISELIRAQSRGDQSRLFFLAERENFNYNLAAVPKRFEAPGDDDFDPAYLREVYLRGEELARNGYPWRSAPSSLQRLQLVR